MEMNARVLHPHQAAPRTAFRGARLLAIVLCVACAALSLVGLGLEAANRAAGQGSSFYYANALVLALCFPLVGMIILLRQPVNPIGWLFEGAGLSVALALFAAPYAVYALRPNSSTLPGAAFLSWVAYWIWIPGFATIPFLLLLFPDGRLLSPRWRWAGWAAGLGTTLAAATAAWASWPLRGAPLLPYLENGIDLQASGWFLQALNLAGIPLVAASFVASIAAVGLRLHRSQGVERQQLKAFTYSVSLAAVIQLLVIVLPTIAGFTGSELSGALTLLQAGSLAGIALAIGVAILRYHLYDIDVVIHRTLVYGLLTGVLGLIYYACVLVLHQALNSFTAGSTLAVVASTLAIAMLFSPLRRIIQAGIDRRFYRGNYDAARTLSAFSVRLGNEANLERLSEDLVSVTLDTFQPTLCSLWLKSHK